MKDKIFKFLTAGGYKKIKKVIICLLMIIFTLFWYFNCDDKESSLYVDANIFSLIICASGILLTMMDVSVNKVSHPIKEIYVALKNILINLNYIICILGNGIFKLAKLIYTFLIFSFPLGLIIRLFIKNESYSELFNFYKVVLSNDVICKITIASFIIIILSLWIEHCNNQKKEKQKEKQEEKQEEKTE